MNKVCENMKVCKFCKGCRSLGKFEVYKLKWLKLPFCRKISNSDYVYGLSVYGLI